MSERDFSRPLARDDDERWQRCPDDDEFGPDDFGPDEDNHEEGRDWRRPRGIFVLAPIGGEAGRIIAELQRRYDPKLAASHAPHVTIVGSSGVGPIQPGTDVATLRERLEPILRDTPPITVQFGAPQRFMQSNIVSLPLDPNGPLRELHDRLRASGLAFGPARFAFTPHATLSYFPTIDRARERELLAVRVPEPALIDRLELSLTDDPRPPRRLFELPLAG